MLSVELRSINIHYGNYCFILTIGLNTSEYCTGPKYLLSRTVASGVAGRTADLSTRGILAP